MKISVLGCGRWGSCIAWYLDKIGHEVLTCGLSDAPEFIQLKNHRKNDYLTFPESIEISDDLEYAVGRAEVIVISMSSQYLRSYFNDISKYDLDGKTILVGEPTAKSEEALSRLMGTLKSELETLLDAAGVKATIEDGIDEAVYGKVIDGSAQIAVLPEPYASLAVAQSSAEVAFTLTNAWTDAGKTQPLVENCIIAKTSFIESNPDGVQKVLADLRASVEWVNLHPDEAVDLLIEKGLVDASVLQVNDEQSDRKQAAAKTQQAVDLIARANVVFMEGSAMVGALGAMQMEPSIPDSAIYIAK